MKIQPTHIPGCFILDPVVIRDQRGDFMETFHQAALERELGYPVRFVQDNQSVSHTHVLRGLHFQKGEHAQAKLVRVVRGRVLDVVVDLRRESPAFGKHLALELSGRNRIMLFIPKGLAHGFLALEDQTVFCYKCDAYYQPGSEGGIIYNDPDLQIDWGVEAERLILSDKDRRLPQFKDLFP